MEDKYTELLKYSNPQKVKKLAKKFLGDDVKLFVSTRKDKKYMRCTRVNGKLKRVHYGDPNLRIKKSNPKRRKSFRARHKCSTAKPGTAKYFSCKNW